jgi:hypothetical protein
LKRSTLYYVVKRSVVKEELRAEIARTGAVPGIRDPLQALTGISVWKRAVLLMFFNKAFKK